MAVAICLTLAYAAGFSAYVLRDHIPRTSYEDPEEPRPLWEAWHHVEDHFYGPLPSPVDRTYGALHASLQLLDAHTVFVEPEAAGRHEDGPAVSHSAAGGIGVALWLDSQGQIVLDPYPASAAARAGVRRGDVLLAIDQQPVTGSASESDVEARLRGDPGTQVTLSLSRWSVGVLDVPVTREEHECPCLSWYMVTSEIGCVRLHRFDETTSSELARAVEDLERLDASGLVLDLRDNGEGPLELATLVAARFLRRNDVVFYEKSATEERAIRAPEGGAVDLPMAVLINGGTGDTGEVVAGALQAHGRAALIGQPSSGEAVLREVHTLSDGSSLHITAAVLLTPDRRQIHGRGLTPDILTDRGDGPGDEQLERAVVYLESEL
ncbi:MAG: S41 family peptidase [Chloroflexota bacterium]|nr:S41 family peptidase [Chloroflexota bacterium]